MAITLFTFTGGSIYAYSSEVLVSYLNLPVKVVYIDDEHPSELFQKLFPPTNRYMPSIYDDETGFTLNQQVAVNQYLIDLAKDTKGLLGKSKEDIYKISSWENLIDSDIAKKYLPLEYRRIAGKPYQGKELEEYLQSYDKRGLQTLNEHLKGKKWLLGDYFTLGDVYGGSLLFPLVMRKDSPESPIFDVVEHFFSDEFRATYPEVTRWVEEIHKTDIFKQKNAIPRENK